MKATSLFRSTSLQARSSTVLRSRSLFWRSGSSNGQCRGGAGRLAGSQAAVHMQTEGSSTSPKKLVLVVAVALLDDQQRVLLAQRPPGRQMSGLWEFPGGKVDAGETPEAALVRELQEELNIGVDPEDLKPLTFASHSYETFHLLMPLYECRRWTGTPHGVEGQQLAWVSREALSSYEMPAADVPLIEPVLGALARCGSN